MGNSFTAVVPSVRSHSSVYTQSCGLSLECLGTRCKWNVFDKLSCNCCYQNQNLLSFFLLWSSTFTYIMMVTGWHLEKSVETKENNLCYVAWACLQLMLSLCLAGVIVGWDAKYPLPLSSTNTDRLPVHHMLYFNILQHTDVRRHSLIVCLCPALCFSDTRNSMISHSWACVMCIRRHPCISTTHTHSHRQV